MESLLSLPTATDDSQQDTTPGTEGIWKRVPPPRAAWGFIPGGVQSLELGEELDGVDEWPTKVAFLLL
jgi:hypothetical protein